MTQEHTDESVSEVEAVDAAAPVEAVDAPVEAADAAVESVDAPVEAGEPVEEGEEGEPERPPNPNFRWYVVNTYSGYENRAKECLADNVQNLNATQYFGDVLIPVENVVEMRGGSKRTTTRKFFPGYMLVQMELTDETWHIVKDTQKVTGFVGGTARRPTPIPEREVRRITQQMEEGTTKPKPKQDFQEGETVRVTDGPFMNFTGTVEEVRPDKQKLRVLVSIFGRATPVELDFMQVEST